MRDHQISLEAEVTTLREDSATTRALTAMNDRDVAEFRTELCVHRQTLHALRETQLEQGRQIQALDTEMRRGFATVRTAVQAIADRLGDRPGGKG